MLVSRCHVGPGIAESEVDDGALWILEPGDVDEEGGQGEQSEDDAEQGPGAGPVA